MKLAIVDRLPLSRIAPTSRLGVDYLTGEPAARTFYRHSPDGFEAAAASVLDSWSGDRAALAAHLLDAGASRGAAPEAHVMAARLAEPGSLAVVTGQQPAPLGGPLYTFLKAASAVVLARRLEPLLKRPVVPVFWVEGDDHDHAEASSVGVSPGEGEGEVRRMVLAWPDSVTGGPVGDLPLNASPAALAEELAGLLPDTEFRDSAVELLLGGIPEGARLGEWFAIVITRLFSPSGLVVAYSRDPALRRLAGDFPARVVARGRELTAAVRLASTAIRAAGYRPQVHRREEAAPFFLVEGGRRLPLSTRGGGYTDGTRNFTAAQLADLFSRDPLAFSPGVTARPAFQDTILPTVAYVGGLAEASYLGQLDGVYRLLGATCPVVAPRLSATIVEPGPARVLRKLALSPADLFGITPRRAHTRLASVRRGFGSGREWERLTRRSLAPLERYRDGLPPGLDGLRGHLGKVAGQISHLLAEAGEKVSRQARSRDDETLERLRRVSSALFPGGGLMERSLSAAWFLARYGQSFTRAVLAAVPEGPPEHLFLSVEETGA
jgi:bacillithiol biosynthesis cysteine-adding enzyme BshC